VWGLGWAFTYSALWMVGTLYHSRAFVEWQMAGGEYPIAGRKKNLLHCHFVHRTFHVDFIRLFAKSFIIRHLRNSINAGKLFLSSDIYSCAASVQATICIQLHVNIHCNNASWAVCFSMEFLPCGEFLYERKLYGSSLWKHQFKDI
jgi:hypothetical protein